MKKAMLACLVVCQIAFFATAQDGQIEIARRDISLSEHVHFNCGWGGEGMLHLKDFRTESEAITVMQDIISFTGLPANFKIQAAKVPNAAAVVYGDQRYVFYNPKFMQTVEESTNTNWASISILAHEIGHHLSGHTLKDGGSQPDMELEADEFSGYVLRKMGATLEEAQAAMRKLASPRPSATHPARDMRLVAIEKGWNKADAQIARYGGRTTPSTPTGTKVEQPPIANNTAPQPAQQETTNNSQVNHPAFAAYKVEIHKNPNVVYYISTSGAFVVLRSGRVNQLGKLMATNNEHYPYKIMFEDNQVGDLLVSRRGELYNSKTEIVGQLSRISRPKVQSFAFMDEFELTIEVKN